MLEKIKEVFTSKYAEDVRNRQFMETHVDLIKLKNKSESIDQKIERLKVKDVTPSFYVKIGSYE